jgi:hypothetical protein
MKQLSLSTGEWLFVVVPKTAYAFRLFKGTLLFRLRPSRAGEEDDGEYSDQDHKELKGQWSIIGKAIDLSEEEIKKIIEWEVHEWGEICYPDGTIDDSCVGIKVTQCKDYLKTKETGTPHYSSFPPKKSLNTLLQSLSLDQENVLVLRKIDKSSSLK